MRRLAALSLLLLTGACAAGGPVPPASLDAGAEACAWCRMAVSDRSLAAQLTAPGEEPRFFDDIGCLAAYLRQHPGRRPDESAYVVDHRTRQWIPARAAVYTRVAALETPMNSHLIAHADAGSRAADPRAAAGTVLTADEVFGPALPAAAATARRTP